MTTPVDSGVRSWTLETHSGRPLTVNRVAQMNRYAWATITSQTREEWGWLAKTWRIPPLERARITATPLHLNRASPQDTSACAPAVKAAIDGLVDAGVLPDDTPEQIPVIVYTAPDICGHNGLRLTIEALEP